MLDNYGSPPQGSYVAVSGTPGRGSVHVVEGVPALASGSVTVVNGVRVGSKLKLCTPSLL